MFRMRCWPGTSTLRAPARHLGDSTALLPCAQTEWPCVSHVPHSCWRDRDVGPSRTHTRAGASSTQVTSRPGSGLGDWTPVPLPPQTPVAKIMRWAGGTATV